MLGKWNVSCTLLFICLYILYSGILIFFQQLAHYKPENPQLAAYLVYGGMGVFLFLFLRVVILKPVQLIQLRKKYNKIPKWILKLSGILFILFCYIVGLGLIFIAT